MPVWAFIYWNAAHFVHQTVHLKFPIFASESFKSNVSNRMTHKKFIWLEVRVCFWFASFSIFPSPISLSLTREEFDISSINVCRCSSCYYTLTETLWLTLWFKSWALCLEFHQTSYCCVVVWLHQVLQNILLVPAITWLRLWNNSVMGKTNCIENGKPIVVSCVQFSQKLH